MMDKYDELIKKLMESKTIKELYENYIVKDITFKEWVIDYADNLLMKGTL